ncbi:MAG: tetratricopeptide repeat protein, partial [Opitutales bacterium]
MRSDSFIPSFAARLQRNCLLLCGLLATCGLAAQSFPLSENTWDNPEFVDRFLGTYGVLTEREPKITTDEAELFEQITPLMQAENYEGAISLLQGALTAESSAAINYTIANIALQSGNYDLAEREYREAIRKFPNFLRAYKNLGLAYTQQSDFSQARDMFNRAIELGDGDGDTYGLVGYCYLNLNQMARARDAYAIARVLSPGNKDWVIGYAQSLMATRQFEQAISVFEELIAEEPGRGTYYTQIANAYISLADYPQAARYLEIIRRMGEANAATLGLLGDIYVNTGLFDLALTVFLEAYEVEGSVTAERSLQVASSLLQRGAYTEAETCLSQLEARG